MIPLAIVACVLAASLVALALVQVWERSRWAVERHDLVNRVVARHTGEVIALDRTAPSPKRTENVVERPTPVGL